jgi:hypothetical protein
MAVEMYSIHWTTKVKHSGMTLVLLVFLGKEDLGLFLWLALCFKDKFN